MNLTPKLSIAFALLITAANARGDVLFDNTYYQSSTNGYAEIYNFTANNRNFSQAVGQTFNTDNHTYALDSISIVLEQVFQESLDAKIYLDVAGTPGAQVGTLVSPSTYSSSFQLTNFGGNGLLLAPNSKYWFVVSADLGDGISAWQGTTHNQGNGAGFSPENGTDQNGVWFTYSYQPELMKVQATPVPEPSSTGIVGIGSALLFLKRRSKGA